MSDKPEDEVVKMIVQKALWFPILNNLTNLIMEKRERMQARSRELMFSMFKDNIKNWSILFWTEIMNLIIVPMLDDIHLAVEIPSKNIDYEFYRLTTQDLLQSFVNFFQVNGMQVLIPSFVEIVCIFI
jgi:hypothetical protein